MTSDAADGEPSARPDPGRSADPAVAGPLDATGHAVPATGRQEPTGPTEVRSVLAAAAGGGFVILDLDAAGHEIARTAVPDTELVDAVARHERTLAPRWVLADCAAICPRLLASGVRLARAHDLRLVHRILMTSALVRDPSPLRAADAWSAPLEDHVTGPEEHAALFELAATPGGSAHDVPHDLDAVLAELTRQRAAIDGSRAPDRLRLLAAAESVGGLVAAELHAAGIPWDAAAHDEILRAQLGPRPAHVQTPPEMVRVAAEVREALGDPRVSLDSPPRLLRALHRAGIDVASTSRWDLEGVEHPAVAPLLRYKKLSRLHTANGWAWIRTWVRDGRYRPLYAPGGVVTGRWAATGGGALQIPRLLRPVMTADPGWVLLSADVSQLEPRVLAAMSGDRAMAAAGAGRDLYAGIVEAGIVPTRQEAKIAVLGALYGGTTGDSGRLVPRLRTTFPAAMALVDEAAWTGEQGGTVTTVLGRSSPAVEESWLRAQRAAHGPDASEATQAAARRSGRDRGRFTRNFVVQGSAAEWALIWIALTRQKLALLPEVPAQEAAPRSGPVASRRAHLVHFLHDEIVIHAPRSQAERATAAIHRAAVEAGELLFPGSGVDFPLDLVLHEPGTGTAPPPEQP